MPVMTEHFESRATLAGSPDEVFAYVDDPAHLAGHMAKRSWAMAGGRMELGLDAGAGRQVGSRIRLAGRVLGFELAVDEKVVERTPPYRKAWETLGSPKLLVIGAYRMGFDVAAQGSGSLLRVFIDYALPEALPGRWLGRAFGRAYARWCTERMVSDAARHFETQKEHE
jgi:polyketide cyclase/dehydrase/lipid transport protein